MIYAIIDMGTNTFNLLIYNRIKKNSNELNILYKKKFAVKLGGKTLFINKISQDAFIRAFETLEIIKNTCKDHDVDTIKAIATSAVRSAENKDEFLEFIINKTALNIQVISGDEEAELIYYGVCQSINIPNDEPFLIMDLGGGSTEFIIAQDNKMIWKESFQLGVTRLLQYFNPSDRITESEILQINEYLSSHLKSLTQIMEQSNISILVGSSGSFDTIVSLIINQLHNPIEWKPSKSYTIATEDYILIHRLLLQSTLEERRHMRGMELMRAEMMVLASIFISFVVKKYSLKQIIQSNYSLKEGVAFSLLNSTKDGKNIIN